MGLSRKQALDCFRSDDLIGMGMEADAIRKHLHPEGVVTYRLEQRIDLGQQPFELGEISRIAGDAVEAGCTGLALRGGRADLRLERLEDLLSGVRRLFPSLCLRCLAAPEIIQLACSSGVTVHDIISRLHAAGADSILGEGSDDCLLDDWLAVHRTAHRLGLRTTATLTFGGGESAEERVDSLEKISRLQQETRGFISFQALVSTVHGGAVDGMTSVEYLRTLAISRLLLEWIEHLQSDWSTQGLKVLQMALRFGVNDAGAPVLDPRLLLSGSSETASEEELRRLIRDAGFRPVQRDALYRMVFLD